VTRFGRSMLQHFALDPSITYLNHGTVGAPPRRVLLAQQAIRDEIELQPSRYLLRELSEIRVGAPRSEPPRLRTAATEVAAFFGARGEDLVFVDNATTGANAVLRSLEFAPGDEILITSLGYGAIANVARYVARRQGAIVREVAISPTCEDPMEAVSAVAAALGDGTRLAIVDHIASDSALLLPIVEIAACCRTRGVPIFVDGAHAPGAVALDLPAVGADWYVGQSPQVGLGAAQHGRALGRARSTSRGSTRRSSPGGSIGGFTTEFDLVGTRDPSPWLAAPAALELLAEFGAAGSQALQPRPRLPQPASGWRSAGEPQFRTPRSMVASMVSVPLPARLWRHAPPKPPSLRDMPAVRRPPRAPHRGARATGSRRASRVQIYNDLADIDRLGEAIARR
jgi:isopenicillin-N epimerase